MNDVTIGKGKLAGKGVYADRDFRKGELVISYNLKELTQDEVDALPKDELKFVHSFWGKMYLYPEPARYMNHSLNPNTRQDLKKLCDYACRDIKRGEMITTNARLELANELRTFLIAYEEAANSRDFSQVAPLIADDAVFEFTNGTFTGKAAIQKAFEDTWNKIQDETYSVSGIEWVKSTYWSAICDYNFKSDGIVDGKREVYEGRGTNTLRRINGNWRIVHESLSKL